MAKNVSDFLLARLHESGVRRIYGYPGDGIGGIIGALSRVTDKCDFIQVRHEEMAAFMACAHAKFTGELGVCLATSGPGAIHLLNGLYDARLDHQPVLAIVGQQARSALGGHYQQEVNLANLFADVSAYVQMITVPMQLRHVIDRAVRIAQAERKPTCIIVPNDVQEMPAEEPAREHGTVHSGSGYEAPRVVPRADELERAARILNQGERVAMLVGAGALHAGDEVVQVAERLNAGVAKALLGKAAVPDTLPFVTGSIGLLGTKPSYRMMTECDTLFMIGSGFPYSEFLPKEGEARGVQIDIDPGMLSLRYPMEVPLVGDTAATLRLLLPLLKQKPRGAWREKIEREVSAWWDTVEKRAMVDANPINPQRAFWELSERLPEGAILAGDSGSGTNWYAHDVRLRKGMLGSLSGGLATMGAGVPYAIAAKFAYPDRPVIAMVGDGAMQMNGMAELITIAKYWQRWKNPRLIVMVLNNRDLNQVTWEERVLAGDPKFEGSQSLPDIRYSAFAQLIGLNGIFVDKPEQLAGAWDAALSASKPTVLEVMADPNVPPLPPHVTLKQARAYTTALLKGDPDASEIVRATLKSMFA
ncbi:MAG TPA: thiamine pyrophosphate-requiring protein [Steroidobacteraceae bacterium]|nr:thiamine pyrophosphate-requiring protein [Steroidobacteraceae bacterium]